MLQAGCCDAMSRSACSERARCGGGAFTDVSLRAGKVLVLLGLLYLFICSLDLLSSAFRLVGGKAAGTSLSLYTTVLAASRSLTGSVCSHYLATWHGPVLLFV